MWVVINNVKVDFDQSYFYFPECNNMYLHERYFACIKF
jgi:hypothetical protein